MAKATSILSLYKPLKENFTLVLIILLAFVTIGLTACQPQPASPPNSKVNYNLQAGSSQPLPLPKSTLKNPFKSKLQIPSNQTGIVPFGVFDLQSGHGKGQWRKSSDNLVR